MRPWAGALAAPVGTALAIVLYFAVDATIGLVVALVAVAYAFSGAWVGGSARPSAKEGGGRSGAGRQ